MLKIGDFNTLPIVKFVDFGAYLKAGELEILLPGKYVPEAADVGTKVKVFIYTDSEDRIIATTLTPFAKANEFACLKALDIAPFGAFLALGVEKDILVPLSEQVEKMEAGKKYVVYVYLDPKTERLVASAKLGLFVETEEMSLKENQAVQILVANATPLGFNVIVENNYMGLVYHSDIFQPLNTGDKLTGYVKKIRPDNKLDIALKPQGFVKAILTDTEIILAALKENRNMLPLSDKSSPEVIYNKLKMSKKAFKKAIGVLYKSDKIKILEDRIEIKS